MADLAKLVVRLEAQTAQYQKELEKANRTLARFNQSASVMAANIGKGIAAAAVAAAAGLAYMAKSAIDNADRLSKLSQSVGVSTEALSRLEYAADLSGTSSQELTKALGRLSKQALLAARDGGAAAKTFEQLGIKVTDAGGKIRPTEELILDVADAFKGMQDGAAKAGLAQEIFGRSGAALIPLLNQGRDGIKAMTDEADLFGVTVRDDAAKAAEQFNDNLTRLKTAATGVVNQATQALLPTFANITDAFVESAKSGGYLDGAMHVLIKTFQAMVSAGIIVKSVFQQLGLVIYGVGAALVRVAQGEFRLAGQEITDAFSQARSNVTNDMEMIANIWNGVIPEFQRAAKQADDAVGEAIIFNPEKAGKLAKDSAQAALESLSGMVEGLRQQVATFGEGEVAVINYRIAHGDLAKMMAEGGDAARAYVAEIVGLTESLEELKRASAEQAENEANANRIKEEGIAVTASLRTEAEKYGEAIRRLNELHDMGAISSETYSRGVEQAQKEFEERTKENNVFLEQASRNVQGIIADNLANGFEDGAKGMLQSFGEMLKRMAAEAVAAQIGKLIFGGGGVGSGGGWVGAIAGAVGGGMASGGTVHQGRPYRVGDQGKAEWFVPTQAGRLVPEMAGGGGMVVNQTFSVQAANGSVSRATEQQIGAAAARGLAQANRRGN